MKKIYTTLALLLVFIAAHAQWNQPQRQNRNRVVQTPYASAQLVTPAALHLTLSANNNYTITIANQSLNFYCNSFFFENLNPGLMMVSIAYTQQTPNGAAWQTAYNGAINFEPNTRIFATIDGFGILRITNREVIAQQFPQQPNRNNPQVPPQPQVVFATQHQLDALLTRLKDIPFDNSKVQTAKNALRYTYYSAPQVKQILQTFSFDNYKLDVAKYAYDVSYDKGNFFVVGEAFSFTSYADKLEKYIASK